MSCKDPAWPTGIGAESSHGDIDALKRLEERARYVAAWHGLMDPDSQERLNYRYLRRWLVGCDLRHDCRSHASTVLNSCAPTWLVDLEDGRLVRGTEPPQCYAALSYVWGDYRGFRATKSNIGALRETGALSGSNRSARVPATVRDAMTMCECLTIRYLKIDLLCITQNNNEKKHAEIDKMGGIYSGAYLTLVAEGSDGADHGMPRVSRPPFEWGGEPNSAWQTRGWALQALFLSPRVLMIGGTKCTWHCLTSLWDEAWGRSCFTANVGPLRQYYKPWLRASEPGLIQYLELADDYNTRKLTYPEDRLDAFAGITSWMAPVYGPFAFGIPILKFHLGLLWHPPKRKTKKPNPNRQTRVDDPPSWAWMGWETEIQRWSWMKPAQETVSWSLTSDSSQRYFFSSTFYIFLPTAPVLLRGHGGISLLSKNDWDVVLDGRSRAVGLIRLNVALPGRSDCDINTEQRGFIEISKGVGTPAMWPDIEKGNPSFGIGQLDAHVSSSQFTYYIIMLVERADKGILSRAGLGWVEAEYRESRRLAKKPVTLG